MDIKEFCEKYPPKWEELAEALSRYETVEQVWATGDTYSLLWVGTRRCVLTNEELKDFILWCCSLNKPDSGEKYAAEFAVQAVHKSADWCAGIAKANEWTARNALGLSDNYTYACAWEAAEQANGYGDAAYTAACEVALAAMWAMNLGNHISNPEECVQGRLMLAEQAKYLREKCVPNFKGGKL